LFQPIKKKIKYTYSVKGLLETHNPNLQNCHKVRGEVDGLLQVKQRPQAGIVAQELQEQKHLKKAKEQKEQQKQKQQNKNNKQPKK